LYLLLIVLRDRAADASGSGSVAGDDRSGLWDPKRRIERPRRSVPAIRFVTTDDFPPFNFLNADGRLTGFNVDLARAICDELDIRCTIQAREWDDTLNAVRQGNADAVIAGWRSPRRRGKSSTSRRLHAMAGALHRPPRCAAIDPPRGLKGKTLAVVARTAHEAISPPSPRGRAEAHPTPEAAREAVKSGDADAHFGDGMQLSFWLQSEAAEGCCIFAGGPYLESRFFGEGLAVAVPRGKDDLKQAINAALAALYEKGVFAELYLRYFPVGFF
jgi:polar amino acid transport system substrate-binding protein